MNPTPEPRVFTLPGLTHQTIAGRSDGTVALEVWKQTLAPGAATPIHFHECEEVIHILQGKGDLLLGDTTVPFAAERTLVIPARAVHQIMNTGASDMRLIAVLAESPARVFLPSGDRLALPWENPDA